MQSKVRNQIIKSKEGRISIWRSQIQGLILCHLPAGRQVAKKVRFFGLLAEKGAKALKNSCKADIFAGFPMFSYFGL